MCEILADGRVVLLRLFDIAESLLRERGISLEYDEPVVNALLYHGDWQTSKNPLLTLKGAWHRHVANVIEELLLVGRLQRDDTVIVTGHPDGANVIEMIDIQVKVNGVTRMRLKL